MSRCNPATLADDYGDVAPCALRRAALCDLALSGPGTSAIGDSKTLVAPSIRAGGASEIAQESLPKETAGAGFAQSLRNLLKREARPRIPERGAGGSERGITEAGYVWMYRSVVRGFHGGT